MPKPTKQAVCPICPKDADFATLAAEVKALKESFDKLAEKILGNGQPGHEQRIRSLENSRSMTRGEKATWGTIGGGVGATLAALAAWLAK
jgi:hypothetical protein